MKSLFDSSADVDIVTKETYNFFKNVKTEIDQTEIQVILPSDGVILLKKYVKLKLYFGLFCINGKFWIIECNNKEFNVIIFRPTQKYTNYILILTIGYRVYRREEERKIKIVRLRNNEKFNKNCLVTTMSIISVPKKKIFQVTSANKENNAKPNEEIKHLLAEYRDVTATSINQVKLARAEPHTIRLTKNVPIKLRPYKLSNEPSLALKEEIEKLLNKGLIEPSHSPWAFPVLLVKKTVNREFV